VKLGLKYSGDVSLAYTELQKNKQTVRQRQCYIHAPPPRGIKTLGSRRHPLIELSVSSSSTVYAKISHTEFSFRGVFRNVYISDVRFQKCLNIISAYGPQCVPKQFYKISWHCTARDRRKRPHEHAAATSKWYRPFPGLQKTLRWSLTELFRLLARYKLKQLTFSTFFTAMSYNQKWTPLTANNRVLLFLMRRKCDCVQGSAPIILRQFTVLPQTPWLYLTGSLRQAIKKRKKPVVDVARDAQCCVHTRDSSCRGQTHRWTYGCDNKGWLCLRVASQ